MKCIRMLTFLPLEQINEMDTWKDTRSTRPRRSWPMSSPGMTTAGGGGGGPRQGPRHLRRRSTEHVPETVISEADLTDAERIS
jgi:tyrosyl-tRNA synthetase